MVIGGRLAEPQNDQLVASGSEHRGERSALGCELCHRLIPALGAAGVDGLR
jgi:hypothetical protein